MEKFHVFVSGGLKATVLAKELVVRESSFVLLGEKDEVIAVVSNEGGSAIIRDK